jgi:hypothetical protein
VNTLPDSLVRFEDELEQAVARDLARRPRRYALRAAVVVALLAAVAAGVLVAVPGDGRSAVQRATAALAASDDAIVHVDMAGRQVNADGSVATWRDESWQLGGNRRQVETSSGGRRAETAFVDGVQQLYDAATNTIYTTPPQAVTGDKPDTSADDERKAAHAAADGLKPVPDDPFRAQVLDMLRSGEAVDAGHVTIDGRDAVRIVVPHDPAVSYYVDAATSDPVRWVVDKGGDRVTLDFRVFERLPANPALLDLAAAHPGARVDTSPEDYAAAQARLFPHG